MTQLTQAQIDAQNLLKYQAKLSVLITSALADGVILTIRTESVPPLAMRRVRMIADVRTGKALV